MGHPPQFVTSVSGHESRLTDRRTIEFFNMVYGGHMNKMLVEKLQALNVNAVGLTGLDGRLVAGKQKGALKVVEDGKKKIIRGDLSGYIEEVNTHLLNLLLDNGYVPVLTPPAISHDGVAINVDGDRFAGAIAVALKADTLLLLSNVPGLLRDITDEASLIPHIPTEEIDPFIEKVALGRMKKKLLGAKEALDGGVERVVLGDCRSENPVQNALGGVGTTVGAG
jgi:acetylglutamate/LysW-gamma-L-alpha-aminoadipate kinase